MLEEGSGACVAVPPSHDMLVGMWTVAWGCFAFGVAFVIAALSVNAANQDPKYLWIGAVASVLMAVILGSANLWRRTDAVTHEIGDGSGEQPQADASEGGQAAAASGGGQVYQAGRDINLAGAPQPRPGDWWDWESAPAFRLVQSGQTAHRENDSVTIGGPTLTQIAGTDIGGVYASVSGPGLQLGRVRLERTEVDRKWLMPPLTVREPRDGEKATVVVDVEFRWEGEPRHVLWTWPIGREV